MADEPSRAEPGGGALGGSRRPVSDPPLQACEIALDAAGAAGAALVGVDLVQNGLGGWTVIELNGAVEFTHEYQARIRAHPRAHGTRGITHPHEQVQRVGAGGGGASVRSTCSPLVIRG